MKRQRGWGGGVCASCSIRHRGEHSPPRQCGESAGGCGYCAVGGNAMSTAVGRGGGRIGDKPAGKPASVVPIMTALHRHRSTARHVYPHPAYVCSVQQHHHTSVCPSSVKPPSMSERQECPGNGNRTVCVGGSVGVVNNRVCTHHHHVTQGGRKVRQAQAW